MQSDQILETFLELLDNHYSFFPTQAVQDLPQLNQTLAQFTEDEIEPAVEAIVDWCASHQPLGKKLIDIHKTLEKGIKPQYPKYPIEPPPEELENYFRPVSEKVKAKLEEIKKRQTEENA